MFQTTDKSTRNEIQNIKAENQDTTRAADRADNKRTSRSIKNLSIIANLATSKKSKLTKSKKSDLPKVDFAKVNS